MVNFAATKLTWSSWWCWGHLGLSLTKHKLCCKFSLLRSLDGAGNSSATHTVNNAQASKVTHCSMHILTHPSKFLSQRFLYVKIHKLQSHSLILGYSHASLKVSVTKVYVCNDAQASKVTPWSLGILTRPLKFLWQRFMYVTMRKPAKSLPDPWVFSRVP